MDALNKDQQCIKQMHGNGISDSIAAQREEELKIGTRVSSEDEAYSLYNTYAFHKGFSIRKGKIRRSQDGSIKQREYVCSKEGFSLYDDPYTTNKVERSDRPDTRTGCKAGVRFNVEDGVWTVVHLIPEHNHPLAKPEERQNLRSGWRLPGAKEIAFRSKTGLMLRAPYMISRSGNETCPAVNVEMNRQECYKCSLSKRPYTIEMMDWQSVIHHFMQKQAKDTMFLYTFQLDQECRLKNLFWRDGRSKLDYILFGDVVVCDASYSITKYNIKHVLFFGVNHHNEDVLFGSAFLSDNSVGSFTWLFETFLETIGKQQPKTIFTNLCEEMSNAIERVFPDTCHRLCLWNILKDAKEHLGSCCESPEFQSLFIQSFQGCINEGEFQNAWSELIHSFNLSDNSWLQTLYERREKWCHPFDSNTFLAKFKTLKRSDILDRLFYPPWNGTVDLINYVQHYERVAEHMRSQELEDDYCGKKGAPKLQASVGILRHAADMYTAKVFKLFEKEFLNTLGVRMEEVSGDGTISCYNLFEDGRQSPHLVKLTSSNCSVVCSCNMFESMGLLCHHVLRVLNVKNFSKIPAQYILNRWTKGAKSGRVLHLCEPSQGHENSTVTSRLSDLMHAAFSVYSRTAVTLTATKISQVKLIETLELVEKDLATLDMGGVQSVGHGHIGCEKSSPCSVFETSINMEAQHKRKGLEYTNNTSEQFNHILSGEYQARTCSSQPSVEATSKSIHNSVHFEPSVNLHSSQSTKGQDIYPQFQ